MDSYAMDRQKIFADSDTRCRFSNALHISYAPMPLKKFLFFLDAMVQDKSLSVGHMSP